MKKFNKNDDKHYKKSAKVVVLTERKRCHLVFDRHISKVADVSQRMMKGTVLIACQFVCHISFNDGANIFC